MSTPPEQPATERKWRYRSDAVTPEPAIPARDLSIEEFDALTEEQKEAIRSSPLYELDEDQEESQQSGEDPESQVPAAELKARAEAATTKEELDKVESLANDRVTVLDAVAQQREALGIT